MCIVLLTTSHPDYALVVIDNRDEFILRPTSRPHWWTASQEKHQNPSEKCNGTPKTNGNATNGTTANGTTNRHHSSSPDILSSRDLLRPEQGTWLGLTRTGNLAVLTNYRETGPDAPPIAGARSRGAMVTAWLAADPHEPTTSFVARMLAGGATRGVGGFSLLCGKLRRQRRRSSSSSPDTKRLAPLAIVSNRVAEAEAVPWICGGAAGEVHGLSNATYVPAGGGGEEPEWPKVARGRRLLREAVDAATAQGLGEDAFVASLFEILDDDRLPRRPGMAFEDYVPLLKESIFIPGVGEDQEKEAAKRNGETASGNIDAAAEMLHAAERPEQPAQGFMTGLYGTQRQTVILVDWDGNVTYKERALWDAHGNPVDRAEGEVTFRYQIEGWLADED